MREHSNFKIGIDLMGSDTPPGVFLPALFQLHREIKAHADFVVFSEAMQSQEGIQFIPTDEVITMEDDPLTAIRHKKGSSLCQGIQMLKEGKIDAFVSSGNTGALMACAALNLKLLPGIDKPALIALLPTESKELAVLDVGANPRCTADNLFQFALMGIAYQKSRGIAEPTVGLLNIGTEAKKGTPEHQEAYQKLLTLNQERKVFIGNIEGRDALEGLCDVLVTDGFTGNVFLKTAEGIAGALLNQLEANASEECSPHLKTVLSGIRRRLHYAEYPGAILTGVNGIVVKCHGASPPQALVSGIKGALRLLQHNFLEKIRSHAL